jgi:monoamine oxidase
MARTPLFSMLQDAARAAAESATRDAPVEQVLEERAARAARSWSRREVLKAAAAAGAALALPAALPRPARAQAAPRVAIVGAGLAGLTAALRLRQQGVAATVYEGNTRLGGRVWTRRGAYADGQLTERGGELIDQAHTPTRQLVQELGLATDNLLAAEVNGTEPTYRFFGQPYTYAAATRDLKAIWQKMHSDLSAASYPTTWDSFTPRGLQLDHMSIVDWIQETVPGGMTAPLGQLLAVAYTIEYGAEASVQSALNLLYLIGFSGPGQLRIFGPSNEKYHVTGGNDQIVARLVERLPGQLVTGHRLAAVARNPDGRFTLSFERAGGTTSVVADHVVLAIPFAVMRASVDTRRAGFSPLKQIAIAEQGMGANSKLQLQFTSRHWTSLGSNGDTFADTGYQNTWEVTRGQPGASGILVNYTGGDYARTFSTGTPARLASRFLGQIEPVLPGLTARWNGRVTNDTWHDNPWTRGSYSYWAVGQYTRFAGIEGVREGNCHFCGEHTSIDSQGYLNGAVETGERAAAEVLADLRAAVK